MTNWITRLNATNYQQQYDAIQIVSKNVAHSAQALGFQELNITGYPNISDQAMRRNTARGSRCCTISDVDSFKFSSGVFRHHQGN